MIILLLCLFTEVEVDGGDVLEGMILKIVHNILSMLLTHMMGQNIMNFLIKCLWFKYM